MYTEKELQDLVKTVSETFSAHLDSLAKSEEPSKEEPKDESKEKAPEHKEEQKDAAPSEEKKPEGEGSEPPQQEQSQEGSKEEGQEEPKAEGEAPQHEQQAPSEDHGYDEEDMNHMISMYSSMSRGELKAHHDAIRKCMDGMGLAKCEEGMTKSEQDKVVELPIDNSKEIELLKSELAVEKTKSEESKKNLEAVVEGLTKFVTKSAPVGKSITSLDVIAKTEAPIKELKLSKNEVTSILTKKASNPALSAQDKQAINDYYFGSKNIEKVRHLLG